MSWEQIIKLNERGHTIGSHSVSHSNMRKLYPFDMKRELLDSKKVLEDKINTKVDFFAFPFGTGEEVSHETTLMARRVYDFNFLLLSGKNDFANADRYLIKRTGVNPKLSIYQMRALISGVTDRFHAKRFKDLELH
jgi:peptidoglycan/xylan/chitin deacetylase (PgdA/CDA1 family)